MNRREFIQTLSAIIGGSGLIPNEKYEKLPIKEYSDLEQPVLVGLGYVEGEPYTDGLTRPGTEEFEILTQPFETRINLTEDKMNGKWLATVPPQIWTEPGTEVVNSCVIKNLKEKTLFTAPLSQERDLDQVVEIHVQGIGVEIE